MTASYLPVRCKVCGWRDDLRLDLFVADNMVFDCDRCSDRTDCEIDLGAFEKNLRPEDKAALDKSKPELFRRIREILTQKAAPLT